MTSLLKQAFKKALKLPDTVQDELALELLGDIEDELRWDETFEKTRDELGKLADKALEDFKAGRVKKLGFDEL